MKAFYNYTVSESQQIRFISIVYLLLTNGLRRFFFYLKTKSMWLLSLILIPFYRCATLGLICSISHELFPSRQIWHDRYNYIYSRFSYILFWINHFVWSEVCLSPRSSDVMMGWSPTSESENLHWWLRYSVRSRCTVSVEIATGRWLVYRDYLWSGAGVALPKNYGDRVEFGKFPIVTKPFDVLYTHIWISLWFRCYLKRSWTFRLFFSVWWYQSYMCSRKSLNPFSRAVL
jgi:hypothetical protein